MSLPSDINTREYRKFEANRNNDTAVRVIDADVRIYDIVEFFGKYFPARNVNKIYDDQDNENIVFEYNDSLQFYVSYSNDIFTLVVDTNVLLLETGDALLLETGFNMELE